MARVSIASVERDLEATGFRSGNITYRGEPIGKFVCHGDRQLKTLYSSRIYSGCRIEEKGYTKASMLKKVAKAYAKHLNEQQKG